ncbi:putative transcription factor interactor and regulator LIM family [Dioscorea sansibarensis]
MDDSCAVCADALEWAAYGPCGHREVCSTCVIRLRFVLDDRRCCICKTENPFVFVTKAMGDYTRVITDFSRFPAGATEGKAGEFWYHEGSQAYFDDMDHYRMIKAMCRLSCSVCDKNAGEQGTEPTRRRSGFRSIEQLKGHLFHQHRLFMCSLCLEGRKVFICEQKLYTRSQLNQHVSTGDSEVDGSESERGGFMGHPMCEFCRSPFYGDNELYLHMSTEHYTCHICQRQHPGQYDYFKNYDDLETHFRQEHFLCENEACLAKKFIVFQNEAEMKRHNAIEHGGHMSRSQRNAALQIPTSFRFRRTEQEQRRGRGRGYRSDPSDNQLSMAIQASLEAAAIGDSSTHDSTSGTRVVSEHREMNHTGAISRSFESLNVNSGSGSSSRSGTIQNQNSQSAPIIEDLSFPALTDRELPETSSRYAQAVQSSVNAADLKEESFPPLPGSKKSGKQKAKQGSRGLGRSTMANHLQIRQGNSSGSSSNAFASSGSSRSSQIGPEARHQVAPRAVTPEAWPAIGRGGPLTSAANPQAMSARENGSISTGLAWNANNANRLRHSASDPNLTQGRFLSQPSSTMASAASDRCQASSSSSSSSSGSQLLPKVEDVQTANKSLVERIISSLDNDEDKYAAFKSISSEYRQNSINTPEYLSYVQQFGLMHLVLELAQLCPDAQKQKELIEAYNASVQGKGLVENSVSNPQRLKGISIPKKGKDKDREGSSNSNAKDALTDNFLSTVRKLQLQRISQEEEVEVLSKDGYRTAKGKLGALSSSSSKSASVQLTDSSGDDDSSKTVTSITGQKPDSRGSGKQRKRTSKFNRIRLGDGSAAALLSLGRVDVSPTRPERESGEEPSDRSTVRGVWRNGGGQRLVASVQKGSAK